MTHPSSKARRLLVPGAAVLAVLLSLAAVALAWRARSRATEALDKASSLTVVPPPAQVAGEPPTTGPATEPAIDDTSESAPDDTSAPVLNAQTKFTVKYAGKKLSISTSECAAPVKIDLDEPRVGVDDTTKDIWIGPHCNAASLTLSLNTGVDGSKAGSPDVQPAECANLIQLSPLPQDSAQPLRTGQVYCLNTSRDAAKVTANSWKMVVLEVTAIAQDGTVTFNASAWDIPL